MRARNIALAIAAVFTLGVTGCDKIPTWGELTGTQPAAAPVAPTVAPRVEVPANAQPEKPTAPNSEEIISKFKTMRGHEISDSTITTLTSLNDHLDEVTEINADGSALTSAAFASIEKLTNLRQLRLNSSRVDNDACNKIAMVSSLEVLALTDTKVSDVGIAAISSLPNLKHLELTRCQLNENGFNAIGQLPALEYLAIESTNLTNEKLNLVCNAKTLKELWLIKNPLNDYGLEALKKLTALEKLNVSYSMVTGEGLQFAFKGGGLKTMTTLGMHSCPLNLAGAKAISTLKNLENLDFGEISVLNDEVLYEIIRGMKKLKYLNLGQCTSLNGQGLQGLKGCKEIEELRLSQCSSVGDAVIPLVKTLKSLKTFGCGGTAITPNGLSALKASIPDIKLN